MKKINIFDVKPCKILVSHVFYTSKRTPFIYNGFYDEKTNSVGAYCGIDSAGYFLCKDNGWECCLTNWTSLRSKYKELVNPTVDEIRFLYEKFKEHYMDYSQEFNILVLKSIYEELQHANI